MEDFVKVVIMVLGLAKGDEVTVVFAAEVRDWVWVVLTATAEGFAATEVVMEDEVSGDDMMGLEKRDVGDAVASVAAGLMALLALPHSASTSAMMSPPPEIESKVRREEMSARRVLRLFSPGTMGGSVVGKGGTCSLVLLTLPAVICGLIVSDGEVAGLSCVVKLLVGPQLSVLGLSRERG